MSTDPLPQNSADVQKVLDFAALTLRKQNKKTLTADEEARLQSIPTELALSPREILVIASQNLLGEE